MLLPAWRPSVADIKFSHRRMSAVCSNGFELSKKMVSHASLQRALPPGAGCECSLVRTWPTTRFANINFPSVTPRPAPNPGLLHSAQTSTSEPPFSRHPQGRTRGSVESTIEHPWGLPTSMPQTQHHARFSVAQSSSRLNQRKPPLRPVLPGSQQRSKWSPQPFYLYHAYVSTSDNKRKVHRSRRCADASLLSWCLVPQCSHTSGPLIKEKPRRTRIIPTSLAPSPNRPCRHPTYLPPSWPWPSCCSSSDASSTARPSSTFPALLRLLFFSVLLFFLSFLSLILIAARLGHDFEYASQEEACSLEFKWMRQYGPTWRTRGAFGVCSRLSFLLSLQLTMFLLLQKDVLMTVDPKVSRPDRWG